MSSLSRVFSLSDFDFELPENLIAQHPAAQRSASRLLDGRDDATPPTDRIFHELPDLLQPGDLLVFNDTRVLKARIFGEKASGGRLELLVERVLEGNDVVAHMRVSKKPLPGSRIHLCGGKNRGGFDAVLRGRWPDENGPLFHLSFEGPRGETPHELMERFGHLRCRPISSATRTPATTPTPPKTASATRPSSRPAPAPWPRPRPPCTLTTPCWPAWPSAASSAPASRCTWAPAPSSP